MSYKLPKNSNIIKLILDVVRSLIYAILNFEIVLIQLIYHVLLCLRCLSEKFLIFTIITAIVVLNEIILLITLILELVILFDTNLCHKNSGVLLLLLFLLWLFYMCN